MDTNAPAIGQKSSFATSGANTPMLQDLIRLTVTRILQDKILLGLVIVGILGIFVGGFTSNDESAASKRHAQAQAIEGPDPQPPAPQEAAPPQLAPPTPQAEAAKPEAPAASPEAAAAGGLDPTLATNFVKWWMTGAMDYAATSSQQNHQAAMRWMTPQAAQAFQTAYWNPEMAQGVTHGTIVAAFQPILVQAQAVNPDGTVVVGLSGNLVTQSTGRPTSQQIQLDLLVRREADGLRIAGLFNRAISPSGAPSY